MLPLILSLCALVLLLIIAYLILLYPGKVRRGIVAPLEERYVAHRGLFNKEDIPENSLPAFRAARDGDYAIELDVQLTKDRRLVVFHDEDLKRMCGVDKKVADCTYEELLSYPLLSTEERIPLFSDVLCAVDSAVPLLIEIKPSGDVMGAARSLSEATEGYGGFYAVQSFHPFPVAYFKKTRPEIPRGILSTNYFKNNMRRSFPVSVAMTNLLANFHTRPDFVAYNHKYAGELSLRLFKGLYRKPCGAWTVRNKKTLKKVKGFFSIIIFDSFIPE